MVNEVNDWVVIRSAGHVELVHPKDLDLSKYAFLCVNESTQRKEYVLKTELAVWQENLNSLS